MNDKVVDTPQLFKNHSKYKRQLRLNADLTVCDVFSIRRATSDTDPHYQTTYQDPKHGKYIITKPNSNDGIQIRDIQANRFLMSSEVREIVARLPKIIVDWLYDVQSLEHSNFIPPGFGWDGKFTQSEYSKRQTAGLLFEPAYGMPSNIDQEWLDEVLDEICRTPRYLLTLKWRDAHPFPKDRKLTRTNSIVKIDYIFIDEDGRVEIQKRLRVIGAVKSHPGVVIPPHITRVIVLTHGVTCREDGTPAGVKVELYQNKKG